MVGCVVDSNSNSNGCSGSVAQWLTIWLQWLKHEFALKTGMTFFLILAVIMTAAAAAAQQMGIWNSMRDE